MFMAEENGGVLYSKLHPDSRMKIDIDIQQATEEFFRAWEESETRWLKYLLLTNAGGAIAAASFLGAMKSTHVAFTVGLSLALAIYVLGIIFSGFLAFISVMSHRKLNDTWLQDRAKFWNDEIKVSELFPRTESASKTGGRWTSPLEYCAFGSFIAACLVSLGSILIPVNPTTSTQVANEPFNDGEVYQKNEINKEEKEFLIRDDDNDRIEEEGRE